MSTSELVTSQHLTRKAIIYIRQSTPHQVLTNQESLNLQYALKRRALSLGWREHDIEIIDSDLGLTAALAQHREGFKELVTKVTLGQVGIIFGSEVSRLARSTRPIFLGRPLRKSRPCSAIITPNMIAIKPAAFPEPGKRSCTACSTAASAGIRCWSSTSTTLSTYA